MKNTQDEEINFNPDAERAKLSAEELSALERTIFSRIKDEAERRLKMNSTKEVEAFYAMMVLKSKVEVGYIVPTACIRLAKNGQAIITVNPFYWQAISDDDLRFDVLVHEIMHKLLNHFSRFRRVTDPYEHHLQNIAMDTALNQLMTNRKQEGHFNGVMKVLNFFTFKELLQPGTEVKERQVAEYYYKLLKEKGDENKIRQLTYSPNGYAVMVENHEHSQIENSDDGAVETALWKEEVRRTMHQAGVTGKDLGLDMEESKDIEWRKILRHWFTRSVRGSIKKTRNRPNKRLGWVAAKRVVSRITAVDCVIDTSGSMEPVLPKLFGELMSLCHETVDFHLWTVDTALKNCGKIKRKKDLKKLEFPQGGGTNFQTALPELEKRKDKRPVIFITDTYGDFPAHRPRYDMRILTTESKLSERMPRWAKELTFDISDLMKKAS
jgi:predicted metal-dependent peptidase